MTRITAGNGLGSTGRLFRRLSRASALLVIALAFSGAAAAAQELATANGEELTAARFADGVSADVLTAVTLPSPIKRGFYLTKLTYLPNLPLTACCRDSRADAGRRGGFFMLS